MNKKLVFIFFELLFIAPLCFSQNLKAVRDESPSLDFLKTLSEKAETSKEKPYEYKSIIAVKSGIPLKTLDKKIIYLHSWFAGCSPCIAEFKPLNELHSRFKSNDEFKIISITFEDEETIKKIRKKYGIKYMIVRVSEDECRKLNLMSGFPTNILLEKNMIISNIYFGGKESAQALNNYFKKVVTSDVEALLYHK